MPPVHNHFAAASQKMVYDDQIDVSFVVGASADAVISDHWLS